MPDSNSLVITQAIEATYRLKACYVAILLLIPYH